MSFLDCILSQTILTKTKAEELIKEGTLTREQAEAQLVSGVLTKEQTEELKKIRSELTKKYKKENGIGPKEKLSKEQRDEVSAQYKVVSESYKRTKNIGGQINVSQYEKLKSEYDSLVEKYTKSMGDAAAAAKAAEDLMQIKAAHLKRKRYSEYLSAIYQVGINGKKSVGDEIKGWYDEALLEWEKLSKTRKLLLTATGGKPTYANYVRDFIDGVAAYQEATINTILKPMKEVIRENPIFFDPSSFNSLYKEAVAHLLGKASDNSTAVEWADAIKASMDLSHKMFRQNGGIIGKLDNYFPQSHSSDKIRALAAKLGDNGAFAEWRDFVLPKLDRARMIDNNTGLPFTDEALTKTLKSVYERIKSDGLSDVEKIADKGGQIPGVGSDLNMRHADSRFFHFKDADAFFEYNERFGIGNENLYDATISQLGTMGRDIGTMQRMGPKPKAVMRNLNLRMAGDTIQSRRFTNAQFDTISGALSAGNAEPHWYRYFNAWRNMTRSAVLGSATIPAVVSDPWFAMMAARRFGLPGFNLIGRMVEIAKKGGITNEDFAVFDTQIDYLMGAGMNRFGEDPSDLMTRSVSKAEDFAAKASEFTHRASLLHWWTSRMETVAGMEVQAATVRESGKLWSQLMPERREMMQLYGIGEDQWNIIRKATPMEVPKTKGKFVSAQDIITSDYAKPYSSEFIRKTAEAYAAYTRGFMDAAVNKPTARVRAIQSGGLEAGTIGRAAVASLTTFKGFGFTLMMNQFLPYLHRFISGKERGLSNLALLTIPSAVLGALAIQMREVVKGRDPRDMSEGKFWMASMLQAGAFGPLGDFLFAEHGRFGRDPMVDLLGPQFGQMSDVTRIVMGNFQRALDDDSYSALGKFMNDSYTFGTYMVPGQNLWYARVAMRSLLELPLAALDSDYDEKLRKKIRYQEKNFGNATYWQPMSLPERLPDLGSAWQ